MTQQHQDVPEDQGNPYRPLFVTALIVGLVTSGLIAALAIVVLPRLQQNAEKTPVATQSASSPQAQTPTAPSTATAANTPAPPLDATPKKMCDNPAVTAALAAGGSGENVVEAAGGGEAFRIAVANGQAPCISLNDPTRIWVVVNKNQAINPIKFEPGDLTNDVSIRKTFSSPLQKDAAAALDRMAEAAKRAGVGEIAQAVGYRSYQLQRVFYQRSVDQNGADYASTHDARAGYSEHQTGFASNLAACASVCGSLNAFGDSAQGQWVAEHGWEYGFITRYAAGQEAITGYLAQPWQQRYIGTALAKAYHDGGWHTLEEFFGLPPAPNYRN